MKKLQQLQQQPLWKVEVINGDIIPADREIHLRAPSPAEAIVRYVHRILSPPKVKWLGGEFTTDYVVRRVRVFIHGQWGGLEIKATPSPWQ